jgi:GNAT superfamily N-acetyltransferase
MGYRLRPYEQRDDERIVAILNQIAPMPTTVEHFRWQEGRREKDEPFTRLMAEDEEGRVVGYGFAHKPKTLPGRWWGVRAVVDPSLRGRGAGRALYDAVSRVAIEADAVRLDANVRDNDPYSLGFAERRGFAIEHHMFESTLDVTTFDLSHWQEDWAKPMEHGIEIARFGKNRSEEAIQQLYQLSSALFHDMPGTEHMSVPPFHQWRSWVVDGPDSDLDGAFVALDGDRYVGVSGCTFRKGSDAYTWFTGTLPEYRGKGIALALKLRTIEYVRQKGWTRMRTNNHSKNPGMLRVNEKLGYRPEPGAYFMYRMV